jgi:Uma2 family endonuclease
MEEVEVMLPPAKVGGPAWPVALLFPRQGEWTEQEFLALDTNRLIELSNGCLEVLPMPTPIHQLITQWLYKLLDAHVAALGLGYVFMAGLPIRLGAGKIREPDVLFLRTKWLPDLKRPANGADFVIEVISEGSENRKRDLETKWLEYAKAAIGEYWVVDPEAKRITAFVLEREEYKKNGEFAPGQTVTSIVLPGFQVDVAAVFAAAEGKSSPATNGS